MVLKASVAELGSSKDYFALELLRVSPCRFAFFGERGHS